MSASLSRRRRGFTLIEMLVSVAIMSFMLVMMANITGMVQQTWRLALNRIDNYTKARAMLDLVTSDLQGAVFRGDLPVFGAGAPAVTPASTNAGQYYFTGTTFKTAFYTRRAGSSDTATPVRDVSLVSYTLNSLNQGDDKIELQRSDLSVPWSSASNLQFRGDVTPLLQNATALQAAPGVVGFRLAFRRADGTLVDQDQYTGYNQANPVVAINVALAVISKQTLARLSDAQILDIQTKLAQGSVNGGIKATWDEKVLTASFFAAYPPALGAGLRTFERWVACPPF